MADVKFFVAPNYTTFNTTDNKVAKLISDTLAYRPNGYYFSKKFKQGIWDGYIRLATKSEFPSGLLPVVLRAMREYEYSYTLSQGITPLELPEFPEEIELYHEDLPNNKLILRDYQYEGVKTALEQRRGIVNMAVNSGKTELACGIIQQVLLSLEKNEKIIFFTHSTEIATQSKKRIEERLQFDVGFIGKGEWVEKDVTIVMIPTLSRHLKEPNKKGIRYTKEMKSIKTLLDLCQGAILKQADDNLETLKTITQVLESVEKEENYDPDAIDMAIKITTESQTSLEVYKGVKELKEALRSFEKEKLGKKMDKHLKTMALLDSCRCFIADEAHHSSSTTWYDTFMLMENAEYRIGLTGTVDKKADPVTHARLIGSTGEIISKVSNDYLIQQGFSAKPTVFLETIHHPEEVLATSYQEAYDECIVSNDYRNDVIVNRVKDRADNGKSCLIIVNHTKHGDALEELLAELGVDCEFIHGSRTMDERQNALDRLASGTLPVLIATTILDEGVDVAGINCIWMAAGGKSYKKLIQRVGRGLRKKEDGSGLEVYDFLDYTSEYMIGHTLERYDYYKAEKFDVERIERIV